MADWGRRRADAALLTMIYRFFERVTQFGSVQRRQSLPVNIFPASLSSLSCHLSQFDATLAHSPPPGWSTVAV